MLIGTKHNKLVLLEPVNTSIADTWLMRVYEITMPQIVSYVDLVKVAVDSFTITHESLE